MPSIENARPPGCWLPGRSGSPAAIAAFSDVLPVGAAGTGGRPGSIQTRSTGIWYLSVPWWEWLHKLRRTMVRSGRERLAGWVEVDETYLGGLEEGLAGRQHGDKAFIVVAAQADGNRIGRIRLRAIPDASAESLHPFVKRSGGVAVDH